RALLNQAGGLAPATGLLGLAALGFRARVILAAGGAVVLGYFVVALVPTGADGTTASGLVCRLLGLSLAAALGAVVWRLLRDAERAAGLDPAVRTAGSSPAARQLSPHRLDWFLCLWLALEVAGYFVLTPFPAARRVLGVL